MVRLYGVPGCGPCEIVKLFLAQQGIPYLFVDVRKDEAAARRVAELLGSPTAGVVLEWEGRVEAIRGVSPARLHAWLVHYRAKEA